MRVGIFPAIVGRQGGGVETYEISLMRELVRLDHVSQWHVYCLNQAAADAFHIQQPNVTFEVLKPASRWISIPFSLPRAIRRSQVDVVHATFIPPLRCNVPLVVTVHDVCIHTHPQLYPAAIRWRLNYTLYKRLRRIDQIICPTHVSKKLVMQHFGVREERISVIPYAVDDRYRPVQGESLKSILSLYGINTQYFLFAGNLRVGNKNLIRLLEAYRSYINQYGNDVRLVLTGRRSWQSKILDETIDRFNLRTSIIETGWLPPEHVPALYSGAVALLFPSLCEGFGLPALESMQCGTPVITSNVSCLPEVVGKAALLVDPYSSDSIAEAMGTLINDAELSQQLRAQGLAWVQQFSWARAAQETQSVYQRAIMLAECSL